MVPGGKPPVPMHLTVSVYDTARSKLATEEEDDEDGEAVPHDYLTPFLQEPIGVNEPPLSREDALQARARPPPPRALHQKNTQALSCFRSASFTRHPPSPSPPFAATAAGARGVPSLAQGPAGRAGEHRPVAPR